MPTIAALLESQAALLALRRTLPRGGPSVVSCRTPAALHRLLDKRLVDAVVLAPQPALLPELTELRVRLPFIPLVAYGPFRPDDGELLLACRESVSAVAVEGVDDPIIGELVLRSSITAERLQISREHLSRQFGAGGAPNLKRVIDLTRIACAAQLLGNPGYSVPTVVRVLNFASPSHLTNTARRIANVSTGGLGELGARGVLAAFVRGNTRSRV